MGTKAPSGGYSWVQLLKKGDFGVCGLLCSFMFNILKLVMLRDILPFKNAITNMYS